MCRTLIEFSQSHIWTWLWAIPTARWNCEDREFNVGWEGTEIIKWFFKWKIKLSYTANGGRVLHPRSSLSFVGGCPSVILRICWIHIWIGKGEDFFVPKLQDIDWNKLWYCGHDSLLQKLKFLQEESQFEHHKQSRRNQDLFDCEKRQNQRQTSK